MISNNQKRIIRIIGDIHGDFDWYLDAITRSNHIGLQTLQLGDFGIGFPHQSKWDKIWMDDQDNLSNMNKAFIGNHDNSDIAKMSPFFLDRFGYNEDTGIFHVGGAFSIDQWARTEGISWWANEELSYKEMDECQQLYLATRPKIVVTHDGPSDILPLMFPEIAIRDEIKTSRTQSFLQYLYESHQPEIWCFGHWHQDIAYTDEYTGTQFRCIDINKSIDINLMNISIVGDECNKNVIKSLSLTTIGNASMSKFEAHAQELAAVYGPLKDLERMLEHQNDPGKHTKSGCYCGRGPSRGGYFCRQCVTRAIEIMEDDQRYTPKLSGHT